MVIVRGSIEKISCVEFFSMRGRRWVWKKCVFMFECILEFYSTKRNIFSHLFVRIKMLRSHFLSLSLSLSTLDIRASWWERPFLSFRVPRSFTICCAAAMHRLGRCTNLGALRRAYTLRTKHTGLQNAHGGIDVRCKELQLAIQLTYSFFLFNWLIEPKRTCNYFI